MTNYRIRGQMDGQIKIVSVNADDYQCALQKVRTKLPNFEFEDPLAPKPLTCRNSTAERVDSDVVHPALVQVVTKKPKAKTGSRVVLILITVAVLPLFWLFSFESSSTTPIAKPQNPVAKSKRVNDQKRTDQSRASALALHSARLHIPQIQGIPDDLLFISDKFTTTQDEGLWHVTGYFVRESDYGNRHKYTARILIDETGCHLVDLLWGERVVVQSEGAAMLKLLEYMAEHPIEVED